MLKLVIIGIAISLVSAQNFKQIQTFPAQNTHFSQREVQPEVHSQPQVCKLNFVADNIILFRIYHHNNIKSSIKCKFYALIHFIRFVDLSKSHFS